MAWFRLEPGVDFSMPFSQHCTACSGKDSWSPLCGISAQPQQKVWSPENTRVGILVTHMTWKWRFNEAGAKGQFLLPISKGTCACDERHKIFYLIRTVSYISDLIMSKLIPAPQLPPGIKTDSGRKKYNESKVTESWSTVLLRNKFGGSRPSGTKHTSCDRFLWIGQVLALYLDPQLSLTCCSFMTAFI